MSLLDYLILSKMNKNGGGAVFPGDPYPGVDLTQKFAAEIAEAGNPWTWIDGRIQDENFGGIHVGDYIPFTTDNGYTFRALIMGIDTYKGMSVAGDSIPSHIDFRFHIPWPTLHEINPVNWNNGLIPVESIVTDGESGQFVLTKEMNQVATVKEGATEITGWSYDPETYTLAFETRPPAGHTYTVTGVGSEHPWTSCDGYLWLNSLVGQVPNSTDAPPNTAVKHVDYTDDGVYSHLPEALKNVIVEKIAFNETRRSASSNLTASNGCTSGSIGKLWLASEVEMAGRNVFTALGISTCYDVQYPLFRHTYDFNVQPPPDGAAYKWVLNAQSGSNTAWCCIFPSGGFRFSLCSGRQAFVPCFRIAKRST